MKIPFCLPLINNIDGMLIGIPEIIPAASGFKLFPTYEIPETVNPDNINVSTYFKILMLIVILYSYKKSF